jgi:hypothetical protein
MSRKRKYLISRIFVGVGFLVGVAALFAGGIALSIQSGNSGCHQEYASVLAQQRCMTDVQPLFLSVAFGMAFAVIAVVIGGRLDPRLPWEKASGSFATNLPDNAGHAMTTHQQTMARLEAEIFGIHPERKRIWRPR